MSKPDLNAKCVNKHHRRELVIKGECRGCGAVWEEVKRQQV